MHSKYDEIQEILGNFKERLPKPDTDWPHEVRRAKVFINNHLYSPRLTVRWLKEQCRISGKSFYGIYRCYTGYYPKEYILYHRIEASKLLLHKTEATVTHVALAVGFHSLSAFCKTFKVKEGVQPLQWRIEIKDTE